jgi:glucose-1-phosphate thymidylyltransferase
MQQGTTAIILAAGAGRRLGTLGRSTSKAMVPLLGRPLIEWVWERLVAAGAGRVIVVAHGGDRPLRDFVETLGSEVVVVVQRDRLGIADAVVQALAEIEDDAYLACACDSLFDVVDIRRVIDTGLASGAVVGVQKMGIEATSARSAVEVRDGFVVRLLEKPPPGTSSSPLVALPLYWLTAAVEPHLRVAAPIGGERHISTALNQYIAAGGTVRAIEIPARIEITTLEDVSRGEEALAPFASGRTRS